MEKTKKGIDTPSQTLIEIEDIEAEISDLQIEQQTIEEKEAELERLARELAELDPGWSRPGPTAGPPPPPVGPSSSPPAPASGQARRPLPVILALLMLGVGGVIGAVLAGIFWPATPASRPTPSPATTPAPAGTGTPEPVAALPPVSLVSFRYKVDNWRSFLADMRHISEQGIRFGVNRPLQISDVWVSIPTDAEAHQLQAEIYAGNDYLGHTSFMPYQSGITSFEEVVIDDFSIGQDAEGDEVPAWRVQPDWTSLTFQFVAYNEGEPTLLNRYTFPLKGDSPAWLYDPPYLSLATIVYGINNGPLRVLDLRTAATTGLDARPGDDLSIHEIWYRADTDGREGDRFKLTAYLRPQEYDYKYIEAHRQDTEPGQIRWGIHELPLAGPLSWSALPPDATHLVLDLQRADDALMDQLQIPLGAERDPGLAPAADFILWPREQIDYLDFESPADLEEWAATDISTIARSTEHAFTGNHALAITTTGTTETPEGKIFAFWQRPFQAEGLIMQLYWPRQAGVTLNWPQLCLAETGICQPIPAQTDQWNSFIFNLAQEKSDGDPTLDTLKVPALYLQGEVEGVDEENPYTFYVDGIQLYPSASP